MSVTMIFDRAQLGRSKLVENIILKISEKYI
jgi:hypothetical protein